MQLGVVFPQTEIGADPGGVRAYAEAVQDMGFRHLLAYDHVLGADPSQRPGWRGYTHDSMFHEVFVLFGYLAAVAPRLKLAPCVVILPQRQTCPGRQASRGNRRADPGQVPHGRRHRLERRRVRSARHRFSIARASC
jgi:hypothetical protein